MDFDIIALELNYYLKPVGEVRIPFRDGCCVRQRGYTRFIDHHHVLHLPYEKNVAAYYVLKDTQDTRSCFVLRIEFYPEIPANPKILEKNGGNLQEEFAIPIGEYDEDEQVYTMVYNPKRPIVPLQELVDATKRNVNTYVPELRAGLFKPSKSARLTSHRAHINPSKEKTVRFDDNGRQKILFDSLWKSKTFRPKQKMVVRTTPQEDSE